MVMANPQDENTKAQDSLAKKATPSGDSVKTSGDKSKQKKEGKVSLSQQEYNDLMAEAGRRRKLEAEKNTLTQQVESLNQRLSDVETSYSQRTREMFRNDPDALTQWEAGERQRKQDFETNKRLNEMSARIATLQSSLDEKDTKIRQLVRPAIASKHNIPLEALDGLDLDEEQLDTIASRLSASGIKVTNTPTPEQENEPTKDDGWDYEPETPVPSGMPQGKSDLTVEKVESMDMSALEAQLAPKPK